MNSLRSKKGVGGSVIKIFWSKELNDLLIKMICWFKMIVWSLVLHSSLDDLVNGIFKTWSPWALIFPHWPPGTKRMSPFTPLFKFISKEYTSYCIYWVLHSLPLLANTFIISCGPSPRLVLLPKRHKSSPDPIRSTHHRPHWHAWYFFRSGAEEGAFHFSHRLLANI